MFGIRDQSAKIREPEADPDQTNLIKKLQVNFDEIYVAAVANRIYVYESEHLKPIDVSSPFLLAACLATARQRLNHHLFVPLVDIVRS